ncbi:MAG: hypothetical protein RLZZ592_2321 [Pseudomonadota bacterium]|jgi:tetratricopeptide (TPR) repeat protein|nr:hypothetical protein [Pseudomonadota bacterium]
MRPQPARLYRIALVMIVRDEARGLRRTLQSVRRHVDRMVVLDTGSSDRTREIARAAGAKVADFHWCDDFAAARNAALDLAGADWHLVLDGDEWLDAGGPVLEALRTCKPDFVGALRIDSQHALEGGAAGAEAVASSWISRVLPGSVRYRGRVHEQPQHALPVRRLPVTIGHAGYRPEALARKADRNARLLQREIADRPDDAYLWYQLGKDHDVHGRAAAALDCFARALALQPTGPDAPGWMHDLCVRRLHALKGAGRHAEGIEQAAAQMDLWSDSPDFFFALGDLMLDWATREPQRAGELLPMIEGTWTRCLEIGERPDLDGTVHGRGSDLAQHNLELLRSLRAELALAD